MAHFQEHTNTVNASSLHMRCSFCLLVLFPLPHTGLENALSGVTSPLMAFLTPTQTYAHFPGFLLTLVTPTLDTYLLT